MKFLHVNGSKDIRRQQTAIICCLLTDFCRFPLDKPQLLAISQVTSRVLSGLAA
jgi:hypothetical protein